MDWRLPHIVAIGPLTSEAATDTLPPGLSMSIDALIVQMLANLELSRFRMALTNCGTLSRSAVAELGTATFSMSSISFAIRLLIELWQLARSFFTSPPQSTHNFSSALVNFVNSASAISVYPGFEG